MFTMVSTESKYDKSLRGTDSLSASEERGRKLFLQNLILPISFVVQNVFIVMQVLILPMMTI